MLRLRAALGIIAVVTLGMLQARVPAAAGGVSAYGPQNGLVLHYAFEQLTGGVVKDLAGNSLDGRVIATLGSRLVPSLSGYGKALTLYGAGHQYVDVPQRPVLDLDRYTLSAWVRYTGVENDRTFGRWEVLEKAGAYWMNIRTDGRVRVGGFYGGCSGVGAWRYLDSSQSIPALVWRHVAASYDGTRLTVYVNGRADAAKSATGRTCISGEPLAVGAKNNPTKGLLEAFWDGRLDEVRVYNRALSPSEIGDLAARP